VTLGHPARLRPAETATGRNVRRRHSVWIPRSEAVKNLGQAPSRPPIFRGFRGSHSEPVSFFSQPLRPRGCPKVVENGAARQITQFILLTDFPYPNQFTPQPNHPYFRTQPGVADQAKEPLAWRLLR
jgi:hypothetical protein